MGNIKIKIVIFMDVNINFKLICDKIIIKLPIRNILSLWYLAKYLDLGSIIKLAPISAIIIV